MTCQIQYPNSTEEAFFFENQKGKRLFAIVHSPKIIDAGRGIVFCHPFAEEKQHSYKVFVKFARELCANGFHVFRFDCYGYGDSEGEFEEATIESQVSDTLEAIDYFMNNYNIDSVNLLGLRLGGTIASLVAERSSILEKLILWSPIIKGKDYLNEIIRKKVFSELMNKSVSTSKDQIIAELESTSVVDLDGYCLTKTLYEQLNDINLMSCCNNNIDSVLVCTLKEEQNYYKSCDVYTKHFQQQGASCELKTIDDKQFWNSQNLFDCSYPTQIFKETSIWLQGC